MLRKKQILGEKNSWKRIKTEQRRYEWMKNVHEILILKNEIWWMQISYFIMHIA